MVPPRNEVVYSLIAGALDAASRIALRLSVAGPEPPHGGPALLIANHVSHLDPIVLLVVCHRLGRRVRVLAVPEAFTRPVTGYLMRAGGHIPVEREGRAASSVRAARAALAAGELVLVYPEGTVRADGTPTEVQGGVGLLALRAGAPVIPVAVAGLEGDSRGHMRLGLRRRAAVVFGPTVQLERWQGQRGTAVYRQAAAASMQQVHSLVPVAQQLARSPRGSPPRDC